MAGVRADDGKTLEQRAREGTATESAKCGLHIAVQAAIALVIKTSVPVLRQAHLEADGVVAPIAALALVHLAFDEAVLGHGLVALLQRAGRYRGGRVDLGLFEAEVLGQRRAGLQRAALTGGQTGQGRDRRAGGERQTGQNGQQVKERGAHIGCP